MFKFNNLQIISRYVYKKSIYHSKSLISTGCLMGIGNPLLDYLVYVDEFKNNEIIHKYKLKKNSFQIANADQKNIFKYLNFPYYKFGKPIITAGGATQNTIRVAQWLLNIPKATTFLGAVGNDKEALILQEELQKCNVHISYERLSKFETGKCIIFVSNKDRTLLVELGASSYLNSHILDDRNIKMRFDMAKYIYLEGFMWVTNPHLMISLADRITKSNRILVTNLHAEFLVPTFIHEENNFLNCVDILFGNKYEALALAKALAIGARLKSIRDTFSEFLNFPVVSTDGLARIALYLSQLCHKKSNVSKTIIFTQGDKEIILCLDGNKIHIIPIPKLSESNIIDTTGCGDAFIGGFLAALISGKNSIDSINLGIDVAQFILTQSGCFLPNSKPPKNLKIN